MKEPLIQQIKDRNEDAEAQNNSVNQRSTRVVFFSTFISVLGSYMFGCGVGFTAPVQSAMMKDLDLSLAEFSLFGSILTVGAMVGAITSGHITDIIGRKGAMGVSSILSFIGWFAIYYFKEPLPLDTGRFLTGYSSGVFSYVVPIYIAEIAPKHLRGGLGTLNQFMIVIGASVAFILGTVVTWRTLALCAIIPSVVQLIGLCFIPESPRWLAKAGYEEKFTEALKMLRGYDVDISYEVKEIQNYIETLEGLPKPGMLDLFERKYLHSVMIGVGLITLQQFGGANGIGFYASDTFVSAGFSSGNMGIIIFGCVQIPITASAAFLMDKCGRRPLLLVSASGTFFGCFIGAISFLLKSHGLLQDWVPVFVLAGVLIYTGSFSIGMGAIPWVIMSEIFPMNVKGAAGSLVNLFHWFGAWVVSYTFNFLMNWSSAGTFFIYSGFCAAAIIFVAKLVPETKGRTLEEIQASLNS